MSNHLTGARRQEQHRQRLAWLATHPELLARLPGIGHDVTPAQSAALDDALRGMRLVRLYAPTANNDASRWSIRVCVGELRQPLTAAWQDPRRI